MSKRSAILGFPLIILLLSSCEGSVFLDNPTDAEVENPIPDDEIPDTIDPKPKDEPPIEPGGLYKCEPDEPMPIVDLRRLTRTEFETTVRQISGNFYSELEDTVALYPPDTVRSDIATDFNPNAADDHVKVVLGTGLLLAKAVVTNVTVRDEIVGDCDLTEACIRTFIGRFGKTLYRRPLTTEEVDVFWTVFDETPTDADPNQGLGALVLALFQSPEFLFVFETEGTFDPERKAIQLTPYEVATRISLQVTGQPADSVLLELADANELTTIDDVEFQVRRLMESDAFKQRLRDMWLYYVGKSMQAGVSEHGPFLNGLDSTDLSASMAAELEWFFDYLFWDDAAVSRLFSDTTVFPTSAGLADIYGVPVGEETQLPARAGLLTRAGYLSQSGEHTSPIFRGTDVIRRVLCEDIHAPDPDLISAQLDVVETDPTYHSTREKWEATTGTANCSYCHSRINAFGFALEEFDTLGRQRSEEIIYDNDGSEITRYDLNTTVELQLGRDTHEIRNVNDLSAVLEERHEVSACVTLRVFEFFRLRSAQTSDGCELRDAQLAAENTSVKEAFVRAIANEDIFWRANAEDE